jgi:hypothetical protein
MTKNWDSAGLFSTLEILAPTDLDNADTNVTAVDLTPYGNSRFLVLVTVVANEVTDTGMVFTITDAATSGGQYAAAVKSGTATSIAGTVATTRHVLEVPFAPTQGRPFLKIVGTKVDADSDVTVQAHLLAYKAV